MIGHRPPDRPSNNGDGRCGRSVDPRPIVSSVRAPSTCRMPRGPIADDGRWSDPTSDSIATPAGAELAVNRRLRRASENGPTLGPNLSLAGMALDPAPSRPGHGPRAATDEGVLLRLVLWLAEVAAEAALAESAP
jgi:hypothetical protein